MKESILLGGKLIEYSVRRSTRSRSVTLSVTREGELRVSYPARLPIGVAHTYIQHKADWILKKIEEMKGQSFSTHTITLSRGDIPKLKESTRTLVESRLDHFNTFYNFTYNRISIRNQKTRWGSCSHKKNLNFNYKIAALPSDLADYIVVHELCHLGELNHSKDFWALVEKTIPQWKKMRSDLRKIHIRFN